MEKSIEMQKARKYRENCELHTHHFWKFSYQDCDVRIMLKISLWSRVRGTKLIRLARVYTARGGGEWGRRWVGGYNMGYRGGPHPRGRPGALILLPGLPWWFSTFTKTFRFATPPLLFLSATTCNPESTRIMSCKQASLSRSLPSSLSVSCFRNPLIVMKRGHWEAAIASPHIESKEKLESSYKRKRNKYIYIYIYVYNIRTYIYNFNGMMSQKWRRRARWFCVTVVKNTRYNK